MEAISAHLTPTEHRGDSSSLTQAFDACMEREGDLGDERCMHLVRRTERPHWVAGHAQVLPYNPYLPCFLHPNPACMPPHAHTCRLYEHGGNDLAGVPTCLQFEALRECMNQKPSLLTMLKSMALPAPAAPQSQQPSSRRN